MILGKVRCGFFQEQILLLQLAGAPPQLRQLRSLRNSQRRLLAGMLPTIGVNPITKSALDDAEFLSDLGDRTRRLDHQLHRLFPELRRVILLRPSQFHSLSDIPKLSGVAVRKIQGTSHTAEGPSYAQSSPGYANKETRPSRRTGFGSTRPTDPVARGAPGHDDGLGRVRTRADQSGRPFSRRLTARSASRLASRSASACRLSQVFLPRPRAISTFARPSLK